MISSDWFLFHDEIVKIKHYLEKSSYPLGFVLKQIKFFLSQVKQFSKFCLCQRLYAFKEFCMEMRLSNILSNFTKAILKSSYRVLQVTFKQKTLKQPVYHLKAVEFCAFFDIQIDITLAIYRRKLQNRTFQKARRSHNGPPNMLFFNFCLFPFSKFQMTIVKKSYHGFRVFLGIFTTSQMFLIHTFLTKKRWPF